MIPLTVLRPNYALTVFAFMFQTCLSNFVAEASSVSGDSKPVREMELPIQETEDELVMPGITISHDTVSEASSVCSSADEDDHDDNGQDTGDLSVNDQLLGQGLVCRHGRSKRCRIQHYTKVCISNEMCSRNIF